MPQPLSISSAKQSGYYWREIARHCDDPAKLRQTVLMLFEEMQAHLEAAERRGFILPSQGWTELSRLATSSRVSALQDLIGRQVSMLEQWRNQEFRAKRQIIPPRLWEAHEVARSILGYDPDIAANVRDGEL